MTQPKWPNLLGATIKDGWVCIGRARGCYVLRKRAEFAPDGMMVLRPQSVRWEATPTNAAILARALMDLVNAKLTKQKRGAFDKAMVCVQMLTEGLRPRTTLYLYEAGYRETIWPRFLWLLPDARPSEGYAPAIWQAICAEMATPDLLAQEDKRRPGIVGCDPSNTEAQR